MRRVRSEWQLAGHVIARLRPEARPEERRAAHILDKRRGNRLDWPLKRLAAGVLGKTADEPAPFLCSAFCQKPSDHHTPRTSTSPTHFSHSSHSARWERAKVHCPAPPAACPPRPTPHRSKRMPRSSVRRALPAAPRYARTGETTLSHNHPHQPPLAALGRSHALMHRTYAPSSQVRQCRSSISRPL